MIPYRGLSGEVIDPTTVDVFRGGTDMTVKPGEIRVDPMTGLVQPTHGLSLDTDPANLIRFGGVSKVRSIPDELQIVQRGDETLVLKSFQSNQFRPTAIKSSFRRSC